MQYLYENGKAVPLFKCKSFFKGYDSEINGAVQVDGRDILKVVTHSVILETRPPAPKGCSPERWAQICSDFSQILLGQHALIEALAKGWNLEQLVGVHPEGIGALFHIKGRELKCVKKDYIECGPGFSDPPSKIMRREMPSRAKLIWDYYLDQK